MTNNCTRPGTSAAHLAKLLLHRQHLVNNLVWQQVAGCREGSREGSRAGSGAGRGCSQGQSRCSKAGELLPLAVRRPRRLQSCAKPPSTRTQELWHGIPSPLTKAPFPGRAERAPHRAPAASHINRHVEDPNTPMGLLDPWCGWCSASHALGAWFSTCRRCHRQGLAAGEPAAHPTWELTQTVRRLRSASSAGMPTCPAQAAAAAGRGRGPVREQASQQARQQC